jgi:hypothetical protein
VSREDAQRSLEETRRLVAERRRKEEEQAQQSLEEMRRLATEQRRKEEEQTQKERAAREQAIREFQQWQESEKRRKQLKEAREKETKTANNPKQPAAETKSKTPQRQQSRSILGTETKATRLTQPMSALRDETMESNPDSSLARSRAAAVAGSNNTYWW